MSATTEMVRPPAATGLREGSLSFIETIGQSIANVSPPDALLTIQHDLEL